MYMYIDKIDWFHNSIQFIIQSPSRELTAVGKNVLIDRIILSIIHRKFQH